MELLKAQQPAKPTLGKDGKFSVMEVFRTVQGEGIDVGRETIFMRLAVCNLRCVWCDTKDSWTKAGEKEQLTIQQVIQRFHELDSAHELNSYVITGGEPLLHDHELLAKLQDHLSIEGWTHGTFETNGTVLPFDNLVKSNWLFSVSPKLSSSENGFYSAYLLEKWLDPSIIDKLQFKFVVANEADALEVAGLLAVIQDMEDLRNVPIIFQPEESANNYTKLPRMMSSAFLEKGFKNPVKYDIRYIPQVHKMTGWH